MARAYLCPVCKGNRTDFELIFKMSQEIQKDQSSGETLFQSDELTTCVRQDGRPDLDVRCLSCGYTGSEVTFANAARREDQAAMRG